METGVGLSQQDVFYAQFLPLSLEIWSEAVNRSEIQGNREGGVNTATGPRGITRSFDTKGP